MIHMLRHPSGELEYRIGEPTPKVGDLISHAGDRWTVTDVTRTRDGTPVVTLAKPGQTEATEDDEAAGSNGADLSLLPELMWP